MSELARVSSETNTARRPQRCQVLADQTRRTRLHKTLMSFTASSTVLLRQKSESGCWLVSVEPVHTLRPDPEAQAGT